MYKEFYGLTEYPFNITPDPRFTVFSSQFKEVLARLHYSIETAKGLTVLVGEVGSGKTMAIRWILRQMESTVLPVYIFNPCISVEEFYCQLDESLKIGEWSNKTELLRKLGNLLEKRHNLGLRTVLIVDEAHQLSDRLFEEIRLLMNFESDTAKHLQIILSGQPELSERLDKPELSQLRQRVTLNCRIKPFASVAEVETYINERLAIAGLLHPTIFTEDAMDLIFQCSEGIARRINNICDNAMLASYELNSWMIDRAIVAETAVGLSLLREREPVVKPVVAENSGDKRFLSSSGIDQLLSELDTKWGITALGTSSGNFRPIE